MILRPVFGGTSDGDDHQVDMGDNDNGGKVWSEWVDITNDTNAPATWSWDDVANLDCDAQFVVVGSGENMLCSLVEIRVTTGGSTDPGYSLTTDSSGQNMVFQISDGSGIRHLPLPALRWIPGITLWVWWTAPLIESGFTKTGLKWVQEQTSPLSGV